MQVHGYIIGDHSFLDMVMTSYKIFAQFLSVFFWLSGVDPHSRLQVRESFTGLTGVSGLTLYWNLIYSHVLGLLVQFCISPSHTANSIDRAVVYGAEDSIPTEGLKIF